MSLRASPASLARCDQALVVFHECMNDLSVTSTRLFDQAERTTLASETVRVLGRYQFDRSAAAYTLITHRMIWDAELIIRVIYETASKVIFIGAHDGEAREKRIGEYWETLPAIFDRKGAAKAEEAEKLRRKFSDGEDDIRIFRHLRNPAIFNVEAIGNKRFRDEVERRWSFSEIVRELTRASDDHLTVHGLEALSHMYGVASHLAHASPKALDLMEDRATREGDLIPLEAGHICRMLSDIVLMNCFSVRFSQRVVAGSANLTEHLDDVVTKMIDATRDVQEEFARSQDQFYSKYQ
jgi:hypothetical protein